MLPREFEYIGEENDVKQRILDNQRFQELIAEFDPSEIKEAVEEVIQRKEERRGYEGD